MDIHEITVDGQQFDPDTGQHSAIVAFATSDGDRCAFHCAAPATPDLAQPQIEALLIEDARRQLLRMPEYRSGSATVNFPAQRLSAA